MHATQEMSAAQTTRTVMDAMEGRDWATLRAALAPDVVLYSPLTGTYKFEGPDRVVELLQIVRETFEEMTQLEYFGNESTHALMFESRLRGGRTLQGVDTLRFDDQGRVREFRVFIRPLPGLTAFMAELAPRLAARRGRLTALLIGPPTRFQAMLARVGDWVALRLLKRVFS
jgi:SnoaL-like domain